MENKMNEKTAPRPIQDRVRFEMVKIEALAALHRLKILRKSVSLVKNSGDEIFVYTANALADECVRFINTVADLNKAMPEQRRPE